MKRTLENVKSASVLDVFGKGRHVYLHVILKSIYIARGDGGEGAGRRPTRGYWRGRWWVQHAMRLVFQYSMYTASEVRGIEEILKTCINLAVRVASTQSLFCFTGLFDDLLYACLVLCCNYADALLFCPLRTWHMSAASPPSKRGLHGRRERGGRSGAEPGIVHGEPNLSKYKKGPW